MSSSQNVAQYLRQTFGELAKAEKIGDYERCLKACSKILKHSPNDIVAQQCKVIALAQLQKFEDAIATIKKNVALSKQCVFEKAYCEYRLNQTKEAIKTIQGNADSVNDFRCNELLAQLLYRCESYDESYGFYVDLLKNSEDDYDEERKTNLAAVVSQLAYVSCDQISKYMPSLITYEQYFNESCRLCAMGQYIAAIKHIDKAEALCRKSLLEDDAQEEEIEDEICCLKIQKAFCQQQLGKNDEALKVYLDISKKKPSDVSLAAVTANNIVSLKKELNLFDARKKMKSCQGSQIQQKFNNIQKETICYNSLLVNLHSNQYEFCRKSIEELRTSYKAYESALLCEATLLSKQKEASSAIQALEKYIKENGVECSKTIYCALIQLYINENMISQAINAVQSVDLLKNSPGMLSLLVALCSLSEDRQTAANILTSAIDRLEESTAKDGTISILLQECATMYLNANEFKTAAKYLEDLRKIKSDDATIVARLVNVYLRFDTTKAENLCKSLPDLNYLTKNLDVDNLENAEFLLLGGKYGAKKAARTDIVTPKIDDDLIAQNKKRKRKRKVKLPKKLDPNIPPDPERWLPKYERSTYKKRKDKRTKDRDIGRGTQGAVSGGTEFDSSAKAETPMSPASPKPTSATTAPGPRQQRPGAQKPKKKKKGGK